MALEMNFESQMHAVKCQGSSLESLSSKAVCSRHKRSNSCPVKKTSEVSSIQDLHHPKLDMRKVRDCPVIKKKQSPTTELQSSLKREILLLERHLQDQFSVRRALEKALGRRSSSHDTSNENSMPKPAKELIKEIAVLELEVVYLEQYLLSLYRRAFDQQTSSLSPSTNDEGLRSPLKSKPRLYLEAGGLDITSKRESHGVRFGRSLLPQIPFTNSMTESNAIGGIKKLMDPRIQRSQSSLTQCLACSTRISPPMKNLTKTTRGCHSQPLLLMEQAENATPNLTSLAEHLGARISDHVPETPNRLSEDVIRCMGTIYCKLAEAPLVHHGLLSSPTSSVSSTSMFSPRGQSHMWSPHCKKESLCDISLEKFFRIESSQEFSGPYSTMVAVPRISRDRRKLTNIKHMLEDYRLLVQRLEDVDPTKMKNEEKLAFWVNIHNALVMHAYIEYGIPQTIRRGSLLSNAAYNVGGQSISADTIQSSILGCRTHRPGQWLRTFFYSRIKFKSGDEWQAYAIESSEPLLHFALCAGSHSDPAVRVYTAKRVLQELETAKDEYIQANVSIQKEQKIVLPKIIESFAKDSSLSLTNVVDMVQHQLPKTPQQAMQQCLQEKYHKSIEWAPHNFSFRYLLSKELVK
ncbi:uncharacterized protein LOC131218568 [Magnolia sinica]|uniref:uncharacterized protein LOC131218568 n=1 Tax=Magnolia sinica TaxID=86752 RepID=UPI0026596C10|nr:uncharacterized protein LOC131218568 [Magnolia sinica]